MKKARRLHGFGTRVMAAGFPPAVSVLPAAALLLQAGAALAAVTGLPLDLPDAHPHRRLAGFGAAAPEAPLAHSAVMSWRMQEWNRIEYFIVCPRW